MSEKTEAEIREEIETFLGGQYDPHIPFKELPKGVQNDLVWQSNEILSLIKQHYVSKEAVEQAVKAERERIADKIFDVLELSGANQRIANIELLGQSLRGETQEAGK